MRKLSAWILSFALILGFAGLVSAADSHGVEKGTISAVDAQGNSFTLKAKAGEETFKLADKARLKAGSHTIALSDLKAGDWVQVSYTTAGNDKQAVQVTVIGEAKPKKS
jgi:hypothetical protein